MKVVIVADTQIMAEFDCDTPDLLTIVIRCVGDSIRVVSAPCEFKEVENINVPPTGKGGST